MIRPRFVSATLACLGVALLATAATQAQQPQQNTAPAGPLAPEKYKDIQVLKDVPADQVDVTMRYIVAATGFQCQSCHVRDEATGEFAYERDSRNKTTAREMIQLVQTVNAGDFGARINCGTCHGGRNRPAGLQPAGMMTPEEIAAAAAIAARQGGAGRGGPPAGGAAGQRGAGGAAQRGGGAGGRGNQPAAPAVEDVLNKYIDALGGRAALGQLQSRVITGTLVDRASHTVPFTIEEKGNKFRESDGQADSAVTSGFDGTAGWQQTGSAVTTLEGFPLAQALRLNDLPRALHFQDMYQSLQAGRPTRLPATTPGSTPIDVNLIQGSPATGVTERFYFDASTGLLLRHQIITRTALNGSLIETIDYADYKAVSGVMIPFTITRNDWNTLDTLTVSDVKANAAIADARFARPRG